MKRDLCSKIYKATSANCVLNDLILRIKRAFDCMSKYFCTSGKK